MMAEKPKPKLMLVRPKSMGSSLRAKRMVEVEGRKMLMCQGKQESLEMRQPKDLMRPGSAMLAKSP